MTTDRRQFLRSIGTATVAAVVPVGSAVADDDEDEEETAGLRVAHASPDAPAVDVYVDGSKAVGDLAFRSVTDYLDVPTGEREVSVTVAGTDTTVFGLETLDLEAEDYTAVARGEVTSDDTTFTVDTFEDTNGANLDDDEVRVRAIHASPCTCRSSKRPASRCSSTSRGTDRRFRVAAADSLPLFRTDYEQAGPLDRPEPRHGRGSPATCHSI